VQAALGGDALGSGDRGPFVRLRLLVLAMQALRADPEGTVEANACDVLTYLKAVLAGLLDRAAETLTLTDHRLHPNPAAIESPRIRPFDRRTDALKAIFVGERKIPRLEDRIDQYRLSSKATDQNRCRLADKARTARRLGPQLAAFEN
jgi:hypothetical protein